MCVRISICKNLISHNSWETGLGNLPLWHLLNQKTTPILFWQAHWTAQLRLVGKDLWPEDVISHPYGLGGGPLPVCLPYRQLRSGTGGFWEVWRLLWRQVGRIGWQETLRLNWCTNGGRNIWGGALWGFGIFHTVPVFHAFHVACLVPLLNMMLKGLSRNMLITIRATQLVYVIVPSLDLFDPLKPFHRLTNGPWPSKTIETNGWAI